MTAALLTLLAAALCGWTLSAHHAREHRRWAESAESDAEELRRAVTILTADNERLEDEASRSLPAAPWPGEARRESGPLHSTFEWPYGPEGAVAK